MVLSGAATVEPLSANLTAATVAETSGETGSVDGVLAEWAETPEACWSVRRALSCN